MKRVCLQRLEEFMPSVSSDEFLVRWIQFWSLTDDLISRMMKTKVDPAAFTTALSLLEGELELSQDYGWVEHMLLIIEAEMAGMSLGRIAVLDCGNIVSISRLDESILSGDIVCMLKGAKSPTVLRPAGEHFTFVSCCGRTSFRVEDPDESFYSRFSAKKFTLR
jgi:hypothetical protein